MASCSLGSVLRVSDLSTMQLGFRVEGSRFRVYLGYGAGFRSGLGMHHVGGGGGEGGQLRCGLGVACDGAS